MAELDPSTSQESAESGTTLVELLVVMVILAIVGTITTVGVVSGFQAQLDATNVAETLDGTRIATQRVRDYVRGATEVCASSTDTQLVLWTDDDGDGVVVVDELDIFEVVDPGTGEVFRRRVPAASGEVIQLIRDDIINAAVFTYDTPPSDQPDDIECTDGVTPTNGPNQIRVVTVEFTVANPDPADPPLTTTTQVRLRNADLVEGPDNERPVADFTVDCPAPDLTCSFDGSSSSDPDGTIADYDWTFAQTDGTVLGTATGATTSFVFPAGGVDYEVTLVVTDDGGRPDDVVKIATPVATGANVPPTADFTPVCLGLICSFDATASTDTDGTITDWDWDWGTTPTSTGTGQIATKTFPSNGNYGVTLTVTDDDGDTATVTKPVVASTQTIIVSSLTGTKDPNGKSVTFTVGLARTTGGSPGDGIVVTVDVDPADGGVVQGSCTTNTAGNCSFTTSGLDKKDSYPLTAEVASVTNTGAFVYDGDQNLDDTETVN